MTFGVWNNKCQCYNRDQLIPWMHIYRVGNEGDLWKYQRWPNLFDDRFSFELGTLDECKNHARKDWKKFLKIEAAIEAAKTC